MKKLTTLKGAVALNKNQQKSIARAACMRAPQYPNSLFSGSGEAKS